MNWLGRQFEEFQLFRRIVILFFLFMYMDVTRESFKYAYFAAEKGMSAGDTVMILGALQTLMTVLMGYVFKTYSNSRQKE